MVISWLKLQTTPSKTLYIKVQSVLNRI